MIPVEGFDQLQFAELLATVWGEFGIIRSAIKTLGEGEQTAACRDIQEKYSNLKFPSIYRSKC